MSHIDLAFPLSYDEIPFFHGIYFTLSFIRRMKYVRSWIDLGHHIPCIYSALGGSHFLSEGKRSHIYRAGNAVSGHLVMGCHNFVTPSEADVIKSPVILHEISQFYSLFSHLFLGITLIPSTLQILSNKPFCSSSQQDS